MKITRLKFPADKIATIILKYPQKDIIEVFKAIDEHEKQNMSYIKQLENIIKGRDSNV